MPEMTKVELTEWVKESYFEGVGDGAQLDYEDWDNSEIKARLDDYTDEQTIPAPVSMMPPKETAPVRLLGEIPA